MLVFLVFFALVSAVVSIQTPIVLNTWPFTNATKDAWHELRHGSGLALDALVAGCSSCERSQCDFTVGYGGSPDENNNIALDALIVDGDTLNMGAVANLKDIREASQVARLVLEHTKHSILVGSDATRFAETFGLRKQEMRSEFSNRTFAQWQENGCQPNFWTNVTPNPDHYCGPYRKKTTEKCPISNRILAEPLSRPENRQCLDHDTIGMLVMDKIGRLVAGTSSNNAKFRISGRAGDASIIGAGAYANSSIGGAVATGDGDIMMRFLPSFHAVQLLENGWEPKAAAESIINRIWSYYPSFNGALLVVRTANVSDVRYGAACSGFSKFPFAAQYSDQTQLETVACLH